ALAGAPFLLGVINRVKSIFGGRQGPSLWQPYYDFRRLFAKGAVYSRTTSWVFRAGPIVLLAAMTCASLMMPFGNCPALLHFPGDFLVIAYLFGLARFMMVAAAMDTGSAFENMGAAREVFFSALVEPAVLLCLAAVARKSLTGDPAPTSHLSLTDIHQHISGQLWAESGLILVFVAVALLVALLAETSRVPVDDPNTHLELTMIHEVIVLDHSGVDLGMILYGTALKLWLLASLIVGIVVPYTGFFGLDVLISLASVAAIAAIVGAVESGMARLRMVKVPQLLIGATALAILALVLEYRV
ncbi:MAG TPA: NADH-quinone oxidoreductase subunit H, partial [Pirellulales bacterium]